MRLEYELISYYVIRMENKDRVKEIWDRRDQAKEMLSKLNTDDVVNPSAIESWKSDIRCANKAYAIFKTRKDIREGKTTTEEIQLSNWYSLTYTTNIPHPYEPDVKILLDKLKDEKEAQHVWVWKERLSMERCIEAEKKDADPRLFF